MTKAGLKAKDFPIPSMTTILPEATSKGRKFRIVHGEVTEPAATLQAIKWTALGRGGYTQCPGTYCVLWRVRDPANKLRNRCVMSDTPMEKESNMQFLCHASGRVLIGGLGIGMVLLSLLQDENISQITVVELEQEIIDLVLPHIKKFDTHGKLHVVKGNILAFDPPEGSRFDTIYFDIWDTISADNFAVMQKLRRKFAEFQAENGWLGCWMEKECREESLEVKIPVRRILLESIRIGECLQLSSYFHGTKSFCQASALLVLHKGSGDWLENLIDFFYRLTVPRIYSRTIDETQTDEYNWQEYHRPEVTKNNEASRKWHCDSAYAIRSQTTSK